MSVKHLVLGCASSVLAIVWSALLCLLVVWSLSSWGWMYWMLFVSMARLSA